MHLPLVVNKQKNENFLLRRKSTEMIESNNLKSMRSKSTLIDEEDEYNTINDDIVFPETFRLRLSEVKKKKGNRFQSLERKDNTNINYTDRRYKERDSIEKHKYINQKFDNFFNLEKKYVYYYSMFILEIM